MRPLAKDLAVKLLGAYLVVALAVAGIQLVLRYGEERKAVVENLQLLAKTFSPGLEAAIWDFQASLTQNQVDGIGTNPYAVQVELVGPTGEALGSWKRPGSHDVDTDLVVTQRLYHDPDSDKRRLIGVLTIWSNQEVMTERLYVGLRDSLLVLLLVLMALVFLVWTYTRAVIALPLTRFSSQVKALGGVQTKQRTIDLGQVRIAEIQTLQDGFNNLLVQIDESQQQIRQANLELEQRVEERTKQLVQAKVAAEEASRVKGDFLANMSHEIRTPMNSIIGFSDLLAALPMGQEQKDYVDTIRGSAGSLLGIINDILDFSKIESGKMEFESIPFSLSELVAEVTRSAKLRADRKGIDFRCTIESGAPELLLGDPLRTQQVLRNLAGNAVKFTKEGGVELLVRCETEGRLKRIRFYVQDTGIGLSQEDQVKVFQAFSQVDTSITRRFGGTGLGLSISNDLARLMGGRIGVRSELGRGSIFWLDLPLTTPQQVTVVDSTASTNPSPAEPPVPAKPLADSQLLLVDDNSLNLLVARKILEKAGAQVTTAADGQEAVAKAEAGDFDLVLMDVQMPIMDGYEATAALRSQARFGTLPIIAVTAHAMASAREDCLRAGMSDYLTKPLDGKTMINTVAQWLRPKP